MYQEVWVQYIYIYITQEWVQRVPRAGGTRSGGTATGTKPAPLPGEVEYDLIVSNWRGR